MLSMVKKYSSQILLVIIFIILSFTAIENYSNIIGRTSQIIYISFYFSAMLSFFSLETILISKVTFPEDFKKYKSINYSLKAIFGISTIGAIMLFIFSNASLLIGFINFSSDVFDCSKFLIVYLTNFYVEHHYLHLIAIHFFKYFSIIISMIIILLVVIPWIIKFISARFNDKYNKSLELDNFGNSSDSNFEEKNIEYKNLSLGYIYKVIP